MLAWTPLGNRARFFGRRVRLTPTIATTTSPTRTTASCHGTTPEETRGLAGSQRVVLGRHTPTSGGPEVCAAMVIPPRGWAVAPLTATSKLGTTTIRAAATVITNMTRRSQRLT